MKDEEIFQMDLCSVAAHEVAHAVAFWTFGVSCEISIAPAPSPREHERLMLGNCRLGPGAAKLPGRDYAICCLAGTFGTFVLDATEDELFWPEEWLLHSNSISDTDREGIERYYDGDLEGNLDEKGIQLVEATAQLLVSKRSQLAEVTDHLVDEFQRKGEAFLSSFHCVELLSSQVT